MGINRRTVLIALTAACLGNDIGLVRKINSLDKSKSTARPKDSPQYLWMINDDEKL